MTQERASPGTALGRIREWKPDPFHLLISTVLSQRTRDECTFIASQRLFSQLDSPLSLSQAPVEDIDRLIHEVGFHLPKAIAIKEIARIVHEDHGDKVPSDIDTLLTFPRVGRKTANCVLSYAFKLDAICVDTHVHRISNRIGLVHTKTPDKTEEDLKEVIPQKMWREVNPLMVRFGQQVCTPLHPKHHLCPITGFCDHFQHMRKKKT